MGAAAEATFTVAASDAGESLVSAPEQRIVYVVVIAGVTTDIPLRGTWLPSLGQLARQELALLALQDRVELCPAAIDVGLAASDTRAADG